MNTKNSRKVKEAYVWHQNELARITNIEGDFVVLNDLFIKVKKRKIKLARIGDNVEFKNLSVLPDRYSTIKDMKITYFKENGLVGTDKDRNEYDDTHYLHFIKGAK